MLIEGQDLKHQVPGLNGQPIIKEDAFEDILVDAKVLAIPQRQVWFADMVTSTPIVLERPVKYHME